MKSAKTILAFVIAKINEYTSALKGSIAIDNKKLVDLGLPSGRLWATENEPGYHQFDKAVKTFGEMLPTIEAWQELFNHCSRKWNERRKGVVLTGPNGNSIFLPANGLVETSFGEEIIDKGFTGCYWSSTEIIQGIGEMITFDIDYKPRFPAVTAKETTCCSVHLIQKP